MIQLASSLQLASASVDKTIKVRRRPLYAPPLAASNGLAASDLRCAPRSLSAVAPLRAAPVGVTSV